MPAVNSHEMYFDGKPFKRIVKVNAKGLFSVTLPPGVQAVTDCTHVTGNTMEEALRAFNVACEEYKKNCTTVSKVIGYVVKSSACIYRGEKVVFETRATGRIPFCEGTALSLAAAVYEERKTVSADKQKTTYRYKLLKSSIPSGLEIDPDNRLEEIENKMPWTAQREAFFAQLGTALEDLIIKLHSLVGDNKQLVKMIDGGKLVRLLPGPT